MAFSSFLCTIMRELVLILFVCLSLVCNGTNNKASEIEILVTLNTLPDFNVDTFKTTKFILDTTTMLQNQYFEEDDSMFFGNEKNLVWVTF
jgi:hypothetical protein